MGCPQHVLRSAYDDHLIDGAMIVEEFTPLQLYPEQTCRPNIHTLIMADGDTANLILELNQRAAAYRRPATPGEDQEAVEFDRPARIDILSYRVRDTAHLGRILRYFFKPVDWPGCHDTQWAKAGGGRHLVEDFNDSLVRAVQCADALTIGRLSIRTLGAFNARSWGFLGLTRSQRRTRENLAAYGLWWPYVAVSTPGTGLRNMGWRANTNQSSKISHPDLCRACRRLAGRFRGFRRGFSRRR